MSIFIAVFPVFWWRDTNIVFQIRTLDLTALYVWFYVPVTSYNKHYCGRLQRLYLRSKYWWRCTWPI